MALMGTMLEADKLRDDADRNGAVRVRKTVTPRSRKPNPTSDGEIESETQGAVDSWDRHELGIHRETVRKYMNAQSPPMAHARATSEVS